MLECNICTKKIEKFINNKCCPLCNADDVNRISYILVKKNKKIKNNIVLGIEPHSKINDFLKKNAQKYYETKEIDVKIYKKKFNFIFYLDFINQIKSNNKIIEDIREILDKKGIIISYMDNISEDAIESLKLLKKMGFSIKLHIIEDQLKKISILSYDQVKILCSTLKKDIHNLGDVILCEFVKVKNNLNY